VMVMRYRDLVDEPEKTTDRVCRFLGVGEGLIGTVPRDNTRPFVPDSVRTRHFGRVLRAGAWMGAAFPPQVWRRASQPVLAMFHRQGDDHRPQLTSAERTQLIDYFREDIGLLEEVTGQSYGDWLSEVSAGGYAARVAAREAD
jgi:hypothetical protein